jgi:hypothetical protein
MDDSTHQQDRTVSLLPGSRWLASLCMSLAHTCAAHPRTHTLQAVAVVVAGILLHGVCDPAQPVRSPIYFMFVVSTVTIYCLLHKCWQWHWRARLLRTQLKHSHHAHFAALCSHPGTRTHSRTHNTTHYATIQTGTDAACGDVYFVPIQNCDPTNSLLFPECSATWTSSNCIDSRTSTPTDSAGRCMPINPLTLSLRLCAV